MPMQRPVMMHPYNPNMRPPQQMIGMPPMPRPDTRNMDKNAKQDYFGEMLFTKISKYPQFTKYANYFSKIVGIFLDLDDNIIEKFCRNFAINTLYVNSKLCNIKNNLCICTKIINANKIVNNNINNEDKINNMSTNDSLTISITKAQKNYINFAFSKKNYCNYFPKLTDMNIKPSQKQQFFPIQIFLGINKFHNEIGDKHYLNIKESIFCSENDSYKVLNQKDHIFLNHLLQKDFKTFSTTIRYRHKNITFVYYK